MLPALMLWTACFGQPLMQGTNFLGMDLDGGGGFDFDYSAEVFSAADTWIVSTAVFPVGGGTTLRQSRTRLHFLQDALVSSNSPIHTSSSGAGIARLVAYVARPDQDDLSSWIYRDQTSPDSPKDALTVFVGVKFPVEGAWHYGWLKFARPNGRLETLFDFDSSDWNPIPDSPIHAG